jgi:hypothetical protein
VIANNYQGLETEAAAAFNDTRHTVDIDYSLVKLLLFLRRTVVASRSVVTIVISHN